MDDTDARWRNHRVSHVAWHAHEKPGQVYLPEAMDRLEQAAISAR